mmetsp:Transcript_1187/g.2609  ORF Transcript_1187/g.2609 Transcript_1187/m.2609 type:complete len:237 (+) Transcript_1187:1535-2245(+)
MFPKNLPLPMNGRHVRASASVATKGEMSSLAVSSPATLLLLARSQIAGQSRCLPPAPVSMHSNFAGRRRIWVFAPLMIAALMRMRITVAATDRNFRFHIVLTGYDRFSHSTSEGACFACFTSSRWVPSKEHTSTPKVSLGRLENLPVGMFLAVPEFRATPPAIPPEFRVIPPAIPAIPPAIPAIPPAIPVSSRTRLLDPFTASMQSTQDCSSENVTHALTIRYPLSVHAAMASAVS